MSFFSNFQSERCPGPIKGNPVAGLCEKVCVQVKKVFDACMKQMQEEGLSVTVENPVPANPAYPLTFVSGRTLNSAATVSNLAVDPLPDRPRCARVQADVTAPIEVLYVDANGVEGRGIANVTVSEDVILFVPSPSIIPYTVEAVVSVVAPEGEYVDGLTFTISACVTVILKVVMEVELLIPSYGYCALPPCQEYSQEVCAGFFELPLYPGANPVGEP
ncbi:MAG: hypothetical protein E7363_04525 [Clostridiales bacterium]|nr:hypothetical protein [Clostridiales bacterium]